MKKAMGEIAHTLFMSQHQIAALSTGLRGRSIKAASRAVASLPLEHS